LCAIVLTAGCASTPEKPAPMLTQVKVERVEIPVRMPCVAAADVPAVPKVTPIDAAKADTRQLAAAVAADLLALDVYAARVDAILRSCSK
jgi:hypothetical protein